MVQELDNFEKQRSVLKKSKLSLKEVILSDYPGKVFYLGWDLASNNYLHGLIFLANFIFNLGELKEAALLLSALPPTQVSVERLFSSLKILKSDRRNRLGEKLLNAMLFLRANM